MAYSAMVIFLILGISEVSFAAFRASTVWGGVEYFYYAGSGDEIPWCEANVACPTHYPGGMEFINVKTKDAMDVIHNLLKPYNFPHTWLGASYLYTEAWYWTDGTSVYDSSTDWCVGEPAFSNDAQCMVISSCWDNWSCQSRTGYICQREAPSLDTSNKIGLKIYEQKGATRKTFQDAKRECEKVGARLVKTDNEHSKELILKKLENFVGSKYWVDAEISGSRCMVVSQAGFEERDCSYEANGFLCESAQPRCPEVANENPIVTKSNRLEIDCVAFNVPVSDVAWYKSGEVVKNQSIREAGSTLIIEKATMSDAGRYYCIATTNIDGEILRTSGSSVITVISTEDEDA